MASIKVETDNVLNQVDAVMAALNIFKDDSHNTSIYLSDLFRINVVNFIIDFFKHVKGEEWLPGQITNFIVKQLPAIEFTLKGILVGYLESMLSCSVKPMITEKMILDGVYFDIQSIDLNNMLSHQPVIGNSMLDFNNSDAGKYLYFGCHPEDGIHIIPDLVKCRDFNAFLWYAKNCPGNRFVWKSDKYVNTDPIIHSIGPVETTKVEQTTTYNDKTFTITRICKKKKNDVGAEVWYTLMNEEVTPGKNGFGQLRTERTEGYAKQGKVNGIITIEYTPISNGMTDAEHNAMIVSEPVQNCLHVFIGCCDEIVTTEKKNAMNGVENGKNLLAYYTTLKDDIKLSIRELEDYVKELETDYNSESVQVIGDCKTSIQKLKNITIELDKTPDTTINIIAKHFQIGKNDEYLIIPELDGRFYSKIRIPDEIRNESKIEIENRVANFTRDITDSAYGRYPTAKSNYYYMHPLLEFNTDLVYSMKWFDEKVFAAQLIDAITGCFEFNDGNLNSNGLLSINTGGIIEELHNKLDAIITEAIENDNFNLQTYMNKLNTTRDKFTNLNNQYNISQFDKFGIISRVSKVNGEFPKTIPATSSEMFSAINSCLSNPVKTKDKNGKEDIAGMDDAIKDCLQKAMAYGNKKTSFINKTVGIDVFDNQVSVNGALGVDFNTNFNMFELMIKKMMYVIVSTFLMPKIYMIIMFNMKLLGVNDRTFNVQQYMEYCQSMFGDIINAIKNEIVEYFKEIMMEILNELLRQLAPLRLQEQYEYYKKLLTSCVDCVKIHGIQYDWMGDYDWMEDAVNYADIAANEITSDNMINFKNK